MKPIQRAALIALASSLALGAGCAAESEDDVELNASRQAVVESMNGLRAINGLTTTNGLRAKNGLTTTNGLRSRNGLTTINGLRSRNGLRSINGLQVNCTGLVAGETCTGEPDGLLSAATGLMSSDDGINTAKYVVRCALPSTDSVRIKDYTGGLVELDGELGLTPEWADGDCGSVCQEKISACLMSLSNSAGTHVNVELSAPFTLGTGNSADHPYQEAVFFGNLFDSPPKSNFAIGKSFQGINILGLINVGAVTNRLCSVFWLVFGPDSCPFKEVGAANFSITDPFGINSNKCTMSSGAATKCKDKAGKTWNYPITTYRMTKGDT